MLHHIKITGVIDRAKSILAYKDFFGCSLIEAKDKIDNIVGIVINSGDGWPNWKKDDFLKAFSNYLELEVISQKDEFDLEQEREEAELKAVKNWYNNLSEKDKEMVNRYGSTLVPRG